eukprot:COSAG02_NODE_263_length_26627_cov_47.198168_17_plen_41_part_00
MALQGMRPGWDAAAAAALAYYEPSHLRKQKSMERLDSDAI